ncbi:unnamed protein product [Auanema sp. JU1783]|nr:unnamed protein product [Auanema sp. JU1783]
MSVLLETSLGDLVVDVFLKERPKCSMNFIKLCRMKYYNLCPFHTIEQNYIAQTGDPTGTGSGGESVFVNFYGDQGKFFEKEDLPKMKHSRLGLVAFVNNGDGMLGSQFYITLGDDLDYLDSQHTIFGQVTEGLDTLEKLNDELCDDNHKPYKDIRITHTIVLDDPFDDPSDVKYPSRSPSPSFDDLVQPNKIALDQLDDENEGKTAEEIAEEMKLREMEEQAQILEMVGDLKSADDRPPDNVLFVCKLNPITTDDDLEIIFSRFGKIESCEIIRDRRTKDSLQYAFIEYDNPKSCEQAYMKMDNVLIDDRRIHVDFSQSVAKNYKWERMEKKENKTLPAKRDSKSFRRSSSPERKHRKYERDDRRKEHRDHRDHRKDDSKDSGRREDRRRDYDNRRRDEDDRRSYRDDHHKRRDDESRRRDDESRRSHHKSSGDRRSNRDDSRRDDKDRKDRSSHR